MLDVANYEKYRLFAASSPILSTAMDALRSMVFDKTPRLINASEAEQDEFADFYNRRLSYISNDVLECLLVLGFVPLQFVRAPPSQTKTRKRTGKKRARDYDDDDNGYDGAIRDRDRVMTDDDNDDDYMDDDEEEDDDNDDNVPGVPNYVGVVVPKTRYGIMRKYDEEMRRMVYVMMKPDPASVATMNNADETMTMATPTSEHFIEDPDGIVLTGFGSDPNVEGSLTSVVASLMSIVESDRRVHAYTLMTMIRQAAPIHLLEYANPNTALTSGLDPDGVSATYTIDGGYVAAQHDQRHERQAQALERARNEFSAAMERRQEMLQKALESHAQTPKDPGVKEIMAGEHNEALVGLPDSTRLSRPTPHGSTQFESVHQAILTTVAARFGLPLSMVTAHAGHDTVAAAEQQSEMTRMTKQKFRDHVAIVFTTIYRHLTLRDSARRFAKRAGADADLGNDPLAGVEDSASAASDKKTKKKKKSSKASSASDGMPTVEYIHDARGTFENYVQLYERGVITYEGLQQLAAAYFDLPEEFLEKSMPPRATVPVPGAEASPTANGANGQKPAADDAKKEAASKKTPTKKKEAKRAKTGDADDEVSKPKEKREETSEAGEQKKKRREKKAGKRSTTSSAKDK
jgi:hypothetical protein